MKNEIKAIHTTAGGYRLEAFKRSDTTRAPEPFCCLVYSPRGALVLGAAGAGDSLIEALVDGAFMAGCHQTAMTIRKAAEKPVKPPSLPPLRDDLRDFEKQAGISVDVLVLMKGATDPCVGRYIHGLGQWQVAWCNGAVAVEEWWPMPEAGTGIVPCL